MPHNPITEEIREIRHRLSAEFDNDVYRIGADIRRRQGLSGHRVVRLPGRQPLAATNKPLPSAEMECRHSA